MTMGRLPIITNYKATDWIFVFSDPFGGFPIKNVASATDFFGNIPVKTQINSTDALGGGLELVSSPDSDFLKAIIIKAGTTAAQRRYFEWQDYDGSVTGRLGMNTQNAWIMYHNSGGVGDVGYHVLYSYPLGGPGAGLTLLNAASTVYINYDGVATGSGGLIVFDGTASGAGPTKYGEINVIGVCANVGRQVRAYNATDTENTRLFTTASAGYLASTINIRISSAANDITLTNSANAPKIYFDMVNVRQGIDVAVPLAKLHIDQSVADAAIPVVILDQADLSEGFVNYIGTSAASAVGPISSWTTGNTIQGFVRTEINGAAYWMPYYDAPTS